MRELLNLVGVSLGVDILTHVNIIAGDEVEVKRISIKSLLPETEYYMTYDGSTTMPACHETVTWVILNKPIYITKQQVSCYFPIQFVSSHGAETPTSTPSRFFIRSFSL